MKFSIVQILNQMIRTTLYIILQTGMLFNRTILDWRATITLTDSAVPILAITIIDPDLFSRNEIF